MALAQWAWSKHRPGGIPLSPEQRDLETKWVSMEGAAMDFEQFAEWFRRTCGRLEAGVTARTQDEAQEEEEVDSPRHTDCVYQAVCVCVSI